MNVLILTPDAVGSTLLQRLVTIFMQFHSFDQPVINLHELTNGLERYYSTDFNQEIVSKRDVVWGYHQSLKEIVSLLDSVKHYKVSRLAQYHLRRRQDSISDQIPFYRYLDDNFFVIACRRRNVFEYALSWSLNLITKKLNVYSANEKCAAFLNLYQNPVDIDISPFVQSLENYRDYIAWSTQHFGIASYFEYETHIPDIENYILGLPIFAAQKNLLTWQKIFGIDLRDWNQCHNLQADIGTIALDTTHHLQSLSHKDDLLKNYQRLAPPDWPAVNSQQELEQLPQPIYDNFVQLLENSYDVTSFLPQDQQQYLAYHLDRYHAGMEAIQRMQQLDILIGPPPIKKQTLREKRHIIRNFDQCLDIYNQWAARNPDISSPLTMQDIHSQFQQERLQITNQVCAQDYLPVS